MKICSNRDLKFITGFMALTMLLGGCTSKDKPKGKPIENDPKIKAAFDFEKLKDTEYDKDLMDEEYRRYCIELFSQSVKDYGGSDNIMISPASIMMALDMVAAGAKGESLEQLTDLFAKGQGPLTQQAYAADLMDRINASKDVEFTCANAVWNNEKLLGNKINKDYVDYIQDTFLAEYTITEFDDKTPDEINNWVGKNTDHMIEKVVDSLDPLAVMVLVNAICFDGKWAEKYEDYAVQDGEFTSADGSVQKASFLYDTTGVFYETGKATGFIKPYEGNEYALLVMLPKDDTINANEFIQNFTSEDYEEFIGSASYDYDVYSRMPEFESDFSYIANETIANIGADSVFDSETADFSGIAGEPGDIFISRIIHKTHIEINREGTRAAAVTAVELTACECIVSERESRNVYCDRPYVYAVVELDTMAPVFIGTVNAV